MPISLHEEDPLFVKQAGVNQGKISEQLHYGGASRTAEDVMVARDCMLALHTGAPVCIQHISSANSVELVRMAKKMGADVHAEATPHHFTLTSDDIPDAPAHVQEGKDIPTLSVMPASKAGLEMVNYKIGTYESACTNRE